MFSRSSATKKKMTWQHFRVLKWRIFIRGLRKERTQGRGEEFVGTFGACTRERYITHEISNDRYILDLKERERERERERTASKTWVVVAMKSHSPLLGRLC